jgi:hypothetical protein
VSGESTLPKVWDIRLVDDVFDEVAGFLNAQHARLVANAVWMLDHVGQWQGDGLWTPESYIMWRTGVAPGTAKKIVDVARRASEFTECVAAFERGELSLDQIAPIVRHAPAWCDRQMAKLAPMCTVAQISKVARHYPWDWSGHASDDRDIDSTDPEVADISDAPLQDSGSAGDAQPAEGDCVAGGTPATPETCWFGYDDSSRFRLHLEASADVGAIVEAAPGETRDALFNAGHPRVTNVDALVEMANRSLDAIESPERRNRYRINIHLNTDGTATDGRSNPVPDTIKEHITCDGLLSPVFYANGAPISVGRTQHIVPDRTRRIVMRRDGGCRTPGCNNDLFTEVHHIVHWSKEGVTDTWNLISLCPAHHRLHHQGRLGIIGNADVDDGKPGCVVFTDAHGRVLTESGARPKPPGAPPPPITGTFAHPLGERLDTRWLYFNDDPRRQPPACHRVSDTR